MLWEQSRTRWLGHQQKQQPPQATAAAAASRTIGPSTSGGGAVSDGTTDSTSLYSNSAAVRPAAAAIPMEVDEIIEVVFATPQQTASAQGPPKFPRTVPLPQMVDILVDLWEAGMFGVMFLCCFCVPTVVASFCFDVY